MRLGRVAVVGLACAGMTAVLSGCVVFFAVPKADQVGRTPKVNVTFKLCLSDPDPGTTCPDMGNSGDAAAAGDWRVLIGFRVPKGTKGPRLFKPFKVDPDGGSGERLRFERSHSYKSELNAVAPHSNAFNYLGYSSEVINLGADAGFNSTAKFKVKLKAPASLIGKTFKVRPVFGSYQVSGAQPAGEPIDCGPDPFDDPPTPSSWEDGEYRICIDSPLKSEFKNIKEKLRNRPSGGGPR